MNISNFGEYSELDFSHANFEIPFDIANETAEEDWVPADLQEQEFNFGPEQSEHADETSFVGGAITGSKYSTNETMVRVGDDEEEWGAFEPDDDEEDENKSKDDSRKHAQPITNPRYPIPTCVLSYLSVGCKNLFETANALLFFLFADLPRRPAAYQF